MHFFREWIQRFFWTVYRPDVQADSFLARAQSQQSAMAEVLVAVPDDREAQRRFGVPVTKRSIQPVYLKIQNTGDIPIRLQPLAMDPHYFTPLEAAGLNHFSLWKRLSSFGLLAFFFLPIVYLLLPFKLFSIRRVNRQLDQHFLDESFHLRPIYPGQVSTGFLFTNYEEGLKRVVVRLQVLANRVLPGNVQELVFTIHVPGIAADYHKRNWEEIVPVEKQVNLSEISALTESLERLPQTTTNRRGTGRGDPMNLVLVGSIEDIEISFGGRWDETEAITLASSWRTVKAFFLGSEYRYSPVSSLYVFERGQDLALQRVRRTIHERMHLRLWLSPFLFQGKPIWVGQVSRDIGVRFTWKTWNLMTHRIDPDVDESRDYVLEDLLQAGHVKAAGYLSGVGQASVTQPRRNLTGDPYHTDGKRVVILLAAERVEPNFIAWW